MLRVVEKSRFGSVGGVYCLMCIGSAVLALEKRRMLGIPVGNYTKRILWIRKAKATAEFC